MINMQLIDVHFFNCSQKIKITTISHTLCHSVVLDTASYDVNPTTSPIKMPNSTTRSVFSSCQQDPDDYIIAVQVILVLCPS